MSLIMDALKKAQQLRLKDPQEMILPLPQEPDRKRKGMGGRRWVYIGGGLLAISVFFVFSSFFWESRPPALHSVSLEKERHAPRQEKIAEPMKNLQGPVQEPTNEAEPKAEVSPPPSTNLNLSLTIPDESKTSSPARQTEKDKIIKATPVVVSPPPVTVNPPLVAKPVPPVKPAPVVVNPPPVTKPVPPVKRAPSVVPVPLKPKTAPPPPPKIVAAEPVKENPPKPPSHPINVKQETEKGRLLNLEAIKQFNLGVQLHHQREFSKAIEAYQGVLEKDPENCEAYNNIGLIHQEMGDLKRASSAYQKAIEINPRYEKGHNNLGILLHLQGRDGEATEAFQKALAINFTNIESHLNLGVVLKKQGLFEQAIESYQRALEINPLHRETHYNIALLYEQMQKNDLAILHYRRFIQLSSSDPGLVLKVRKHLEDLIASEKIKGN